MEREITQYVHKTGQAFWTKLIDDALLAIGARYWSGPRVKYLYKRDEHSCNELDGNVPNALECFCHCRLINVGQILILGAQKVMACGQGSWRGRRRRSIKAVRGLDVGDRWN